MSEQGGIYIGTSGWHYDHWKGPFYPADLPADQFLAAYVQHFKSVEINSTFYGLPETATLKTWRDTAPAGFIFAVKASRYITHMKKLKDPQEPLDNLLGRVEALGDSLGPILFQLPPNWNFNAERLASFLDALPGGFRYAFEFRNESWFNGRAVDLLADHNAAFCIYQIAGRDSPRQVTANFVYVRLHGPGDNAYQGNYNTQTLSGWARALSGWAREGRDAYCYFDNDQNGYAARNAADLRDMLKGEGS
jgi:uncharacterized protein YecE (DUF72 family)